MLFHLIFICLSLISVFFCNWCLGVGRIGFYVRPSTSLFFPLLCKSMSIRSLFCVSGYRGVIAASCMARMFIIISHV